MNRQDYEVAASQPAQPRQHDSRLAPHQAYTRPELARHGAVRDLTAGGSGPKKENHGHPDGHA